MSISKDEKEIMYKTYKTEQMLRSNRMVTLTILSKEEEIERLLDFIKMGLEVYQCSNEIWLQLSEVIDDIYINIIRYAFPLEEGLVKVSMNYIYKQKVVEILFTHEGIPFNPLENRLDTRNNIYENRLATLNNTSENRLLHEQATALIKDNIDEASYVYLNNKNITTLKRYIN